MAPNPNLNSVQFSSVPVDHQEHHDAIGKLMANHPADYASVSLPENDPSHQSWAVQDQHGNTHGYYYTAPQGGGHYLGGLAAMPGSSGISGHALGTLQHKTTHLDGYDRPDVAGIYAKRGFEVTDRNPWSEEYKPDGWDKSAHGEPDYVDMKRGAMRSRGNTSVSQAYAQLPSGDKPAAKPNYA